MRPRRKVLFLHQAFDRRPHRQAIRQRELLDLLHRALAQAAGRRIDDPQQADRISRRQGHLQVRQHVLDFGTLIEAEAAHHGVAQVVTPQRFLDLPGL